MAFYNPFVEGEPLIPSTFNNRFDEFDGSFSARGISPMERGAFGDGNNDDRAVLVEIDDEDDPLLLQAGKTFRVDFDLTLSGVVVAAGGKIKPANGVRVTLPPTFEGSPGCLDTSEGGDFSIPAAVAIQPEWFCDGGSGTASDPWTSTDGTGGAKAALAALQEGGMVRWRGHYAVTEGGAISDVDNRHLNFGGAVIQVTAWAKTATANNFQDPDDTDSYFIPWIDLGPNTVAAGDTSSRDTLLIDGTGFIDGGSSGDYEDVILFGLNDVRNIYIRDVRTRRIRYPYFGAVRDTVRMYGGKHRSGGDILHVPNFFTSLVPQDIEVRGVHSSLCEWVVNVDGAFSDLTVGKCVVIPADNFGFVRVKTGNGASLSSDSLHIHGSDVEQNEGLTIIHVVSDGTNTLRGLTVDGRCKFAPAEDANTTLIKAEAVAGAVSIRDCNLFGGAVTALDFGTVAANTAVIIEGNDFGQTAGSSGTQWTFDTVNGHIRFGRNRYGATPGTQDHPLASTSFDAGGIGSSIASASEIALPDHHSTYFLVTGTTTITSLAASWAGRQITLRFGGALTVTDGTGTLRLSADFTTAAHATLSLVCDGTRWYEVARSQN